MLDELRDALELATEEELQYLTQLLFCRKLNPLDYLQTPDPIDVQSQSYEEWLDTIEQRIRYLGADGLTVLQGRSQGVSYRHILISICRYLKLSYRQAMTTTEIEEEIFLHLVSQTWKRLPKKEQKSLNRKIQNALAQSELPEPLPAQWQHNPVNLLLKGSSVLAVNSLLRPFLLKQVTQQIALHFATYQATKNVMFTGGKVATNSLKNQITIQMAKRGITLNLARYGAIKTVFSILGPLLWMSFFADLGWKAIATNYGRIIPTVFALAQIRLTRSDWEWVGV